MFHGHGLQIGCTGLQDWKKPAVLQVNAPLGCFGILVRTQRWTTGITGPCMDLMKSSLYAQNARMFNKKKTEPFCTVSCMWGSMRKEIVGLGGGRRQEKQKKLVTWEEWRGAHVRDILIGSCKQFSALKLTLSASKILHYCFFMTQSIDLIKRAIMCIILLFYMGKHAGFKHISHFCFTTAQRKHFPVRAPTHVLNTWPAPPPAEGDGEYPEILLLRRNTSISGTAYGND